MDDQQYEQGTENNAVEACVEEVQAAAVEGMEDVTAKLRKRFVENTEEVENAEEAETVEEPVEEINVNICQKCGYELADDQNFCPHCGTQKGVAPKLLCSKCGAELAPGQQFCVKCGTPASAAKTQNPLLAKLNGLSKQTKMIIAGVAAAVVILAAVLGAVISNSGKNFNKMFGEYAGKRWCTIAEDGTWIKIDSNPNNVDSDDYTDWDTLLAADAASDHINTTLGFPTSLKDKMDTTTWSMGRQTEETDKYRVSWTYHPDKGFEALYEVK